MADTSARILRLLSLLEARVEWPGGDLAERLGVSARTVRRDIDTLRELGYPVEAVPGPGGGYRLGAAGKLPPLVLDDDQAIAIAVVQVVGGAARRLHFHRAHLPGHPVFGDHIAIGHGAHGFLGTGRDAVGPGAGAGAGRQQQQHREGKRQSGHGRFSQALPAILAAAPHGWVMKPGSGRLRRIGT